MNDSTDTFIRIRPRLFGIAYRMLGSRADAEDIVQDAWLRWNDNGTKEQLQSSDAWLVTVVTRLSIDRLRGAKLERETYTGPWLPEPLVEQAVDSPEQRLEQIGDISMAFMLMLERLGPEERAVFLLHDIFEFDYAEIAATVGKTEAACRQLLSRARERVRTDRPRFPVDRNAHLDLIGKFAQAMRAGERDQLAQLFTAGATFTGDGGDKATAIRRVVVGADRIARFYANLLRKYPGMEMHSATINGEPGLVCLAEGKVDTVVSFAFEGDRISAIYAVRNPDKLSYVRMP